MATKQLDIKVVIPDIVARGVLWKDLEEIDNRAKAAANAGDADVEAELGREERRVQARLQVPMAERQRLQRAAERIIKAELPRMIESLLHDATAGNASLRPDPLTTAGWKIRDALQDLHQPWRDGQRLGVEP